MPDTIQRHTLQDLPLERYLPPDINVPLSPSKHRRPSKRPLSPGAPILYSPTKRRILADEMIYASAKAVKTPLASSAHGRFAPAYFNELLRGPGSPAKKLDFGQPKASIDASSPAVFHPISKDASRDASPSRSASAPAKLAPSPEFTSKRMTRSQTRAAATCAAAIEEPRVEDRFDARSRSSSHPSAPVMLPQEVFSSDRQSVHYPGFDVFQDTYPCIPTTLSTPDVEMEDLTPPPASVPSKRDKEAEKENVAPRRKMHKSIITTAAPADDLWAKAGLLSPEVKRREVEQSDKVKTISATPHAKRIYGDIIMEKASATPKARTFRLLDRPSNMMMVGVSPIRSPIGKAEREARRKAMAEEADDFDDDEDM